MVVLLVLSVPSFRRQTVLGIGLALLYPNRFPRVNSAEGDALSSSVAPQMQSQPNGAASTGEHR